MPKSMAGVMDEYKSGDLHSGSSGGPRVRNRDQALAIAYSENKKNSGKDRLRKSLNKVGIGKI